MKRYKFPIILAVIAALFFLLGILAITVWKPQQEVVAEGVPGQPYVMTREGALDLYAAEVEVTAASPDGGPVWVASGKPDEVLAWLAGKPYEEITGLAEIDSLKMLPHGVDEIAQSDDGKSKDNAEKAEDKSESNENVIESDMWTSQKHANGEVHLTITGEQLNESLLAATDGEGAAPTITMKWDTPRPNVLAIISFITSAVFAFLALLLALTRKRKGAAQAEQELQDIVFPAPASATGDYDTPGEEQELEAAAFVETDGGDDAELVGWVDDPAPEFDDTQGDWSGEETTIAQWQAAAEQADPAEFTAVADDQNMEELDYAGSDYEQAGYSPVGYETAEYETTEYEVPEYGTVEYGGDEYSEIEYEHYDQQSGYQVEEEEYIVAPETLYSQESVEVFDDSSDVAPDQQGLVVSEYETGDVQQGVMRTPEPVVEEVTTDSQMMNLTALQSGGAFPTRRAMREARERGVEQLRVEGRTFVTPSKAEPPTDVLQRRTTETSKWEDLFPGAQDEGADK